MDFSFECCNSVSVWGGGKRERQAGRKRGRGISGVGEGGSETMKETGRFIAAD